MFSAFFNILFWMIPISIWRNYYPDYEIEFDGTN